MMKDWAAMVGPVGPIALGLAAAAFLPGLAHHPADAASSTASRTPILKIEQLTPRQRMELPDATMVTLEGRGTVSLGALRGQHRAREQRFANAVNRGQTAAAAIAQSANTAHFTGINGPPLFRRVPPRPWPNNYPADLRAFCNAAKASGCLYFPAATNLFADSLLDLKFWDEIDPFTTDASTCSAGGGVLESLGGSLFACFYKYPASYRHAFDPGQPPPGQATGAGVTSTQQCSDPSLTVAVDPAGAIKIDGPPIPFSSIEGVLSTGANPTCVVFVYVPL